jgi:hypothetical protein
MGRWKTNPRNIEHERAWAEALALLDPSEPARVDTPPRQWLTSIDDCGRFGRQGFAGNVAAFLPGRIEARPRRDMRWTRAPS